MDEINVYSGILLRRYFERFKEITYHGVPLCKYNYFQFYGFVKNNWNYNWAKNNLPYLRSEISRFRASEIYSWADEPYPFDPHPDGVILMRGGFVDIASQHLPKERYFLISHTPEEVGLIKASMPDQEAHSIDEYFQDNPKAVQQLNEQVAQIISAQKDDPILGSLALLRWFQKNMSKTVQIFDAVNLLFEQIKVGAVLTISAINGMESALNLFAKARRIPSFTGQHGLISDQAVYGHIPVLATKKLVWGKSHLEWYKQYGVPESRVSVIGSPRFEVIFNKQWCGKAQLCQRLKVDPSRTIIIFATQRWYLSLVNVPLVLEGLKAIPNAFLVLLLHPSESQVVKHYQELTKDYPNCQVVPFGHISLYDALSGADIFMTGHSTSALEAMFFKLPVITVEPAPVIYSYADAGASLRVTNATEVQQIVSQLIDDAAFRASAVNRYQDYLTDQCIPDGLASQRLFDEIDLLCRTGGVA